MAVTPDDVLRVAALARIAVPADRVDVLARELDGILAHMDVLSRAAALAAGREVPGMPLGADEPGSVRLARPRESFAPQVRDGFFLVPRLDTHDDSATGA